MRADSGAAPPITDSRMRVGVSSCLLGSNVRYDGGHKRAPVLTEVFGPFVEWVPVCPEVEIGMGVPREPVHLVRHGGECRLVTCTTGIDHTEAMREWGGTRIAHLQDLRLSGYVLKSRSPSCGLTGVDLFDGDGLADSGGRGLFAQLLATCCPALPAEDERRLNDSVVRDHFIERMFAYRRLQTVFAAPWDIASLTAFIAAHHLALEAHSAGAADRLGSLLASAADGHHHGLRETFERVFMAAYAEPITTVGLAGLLDLHPDPDERRMRASCLTLPRV